MRATKISRSTFHRFTIAWVVLFPALACAVDFRTTTFNANMRVNQDRTITVDETIQIVPSGNGAINDLAVAEAPSGFKKVQYLVNRATIGNEKTTQPLTVKPDGNGNLVVSLPAGTVNGSTQLHVNYSVLGTFTDKSGGTLGARATLSWNMVPTSWPSKIESGLLEIGYPAGVVPVYTGANSGTGSDHVAVEKSPNTAFSGDVSKLNVSEVRDGVTMQPPSLPPKAGLHVLIAIARKDLKPAPKKLGAVGTTSAPARPPRRDRDDRPALFKPPVVAAPKKAAPKKQMSAWVVGLPLVVPIVFFLLFAKRLKFMSGHGYATSAVSEGIGPAEAGYLLEGSLKVRHVLGALSAVVAGHYSQPDSATIDPAAIGPVERRAIEILKRRSTINDAKEVRTFLSGYIQELQSILTQNLVSLSMLETPSPAAKFGPFVGALVLLLITGALSIRNNLAIGGTVTLVALIVTAFLALSLSSLTQRGVRAKLRVVGLHKFLSAHAQELKSGEADYLIPLKPYAVAFGLAKEDAF